MVAKWIELVTGPLEQKKQYRQAKSRLESLPTPYREAASAVERYLMYYGGITDGDTTVQMFVDLADLWQQAAADGTPVRKIVGEDPVEFAEAFAAAYDGTRWIDKERRRLVQSINAAEASSN